MSKAEKLAAKILSGRSDKSFSFDDLCYVIERAGFHLRSGKGSHRIHYKEGVVEIVNVSTRYELIIYWSKDDDCFVVEVPELPGCMADGLTYAEAVANAEVVIDEWIETARKLGRPIPEPRGKLAYA